MTKANNHNHVHHSDEPGIADDPAAQSLSDALTVSFTLLKIIMGALVIFYLGSGFFGVTAQERAVRLLFGKIVGQEGNQVYSEGWHVGFPFPIGQVIKVPTSTRTVEISTAYWRQISAGDVGKTEAEQSMRAGPLNPEKDGSLITGDANIVHGRFVVSYTIPKENVVDFITNVGLSELGAKLEDGTTVRDVMQFADHIVRNIAEQAIVNAVAQTTADEVIAGRANEAIARNHAQELLDGLHSGIRIERFAMTDQAMPLPVRDAYNAVSNAESERAQKMEKARQERARILGETAGQAHELLYALIQRYEHARSAQDEQLVEQLGAQLDTVLGTLQISDPNGGVIPIGGQVAQVINEARTYRTQVVEQIKTEAATFKSLMDQYKKSPRIVTNRLWQNAREEIFAGNSEIMYLREGAKLYITLGRDPEFARKRDKDRLIKEQEEAKATSSANR